MNYNKAFNRYQINCLLILYISSLLSGMFILKSSVTVRPENLISPIFIIGMLFYVMAITDRINVSKLSLFYVCFICLNWMVSVFLSPVLMDSIKGLLTLTLLIFTFITTISTISLDNQSLVKLSTIAFLVLGTIEAVYGIVSYVVYLTNGTDIGGLMHGQQGLSISVKGTFEEANIFGAFNSIVILLILSLLINGYYKKKNWILIILLIINFGAIILSWTRSAWLGTLLGVLFILLINKSQIIKLKNFLLLIFIAGSIVLIINYISPIFDKLSGNNGLFYTKISEIFDPQSDTAVYRMNEFQVAINQWSHSPFFGNGYLSIKAFGETKWISNIFLLLLDDSGIIGALLFFCPLAWVLFKSIKVSHLASKLSSPQYSAYITGLTAGLISLLFVFNFTPTHTLLFFWWYLSLLILFITNYKKMMFIQVDNDAKSSK
ncbi:O-antigen ligase family protein [Priestia aryabhattai]|uniref:O-antigen ligase family protein n=1 Tax=Priestia aryabhattai TaxID=412384 RepID=UPI002E20A399|nr:O-antigen ligase family protein [Priestia aryabhattai]